MIKKSSLLRINKKKICCSLLSEITCFIGPDTAEQGSRHLDSRCFKMFICPNLVSDTGEIQFSVPLQLGGGGT